MSKIKYTCVCRKPIKFCSQDPCLKQVKTKTVYKLKRSPLKKTPLKKSKFKPSKKSIDKRIVEIKAFQEFAREAYAYHTKGTQGEAYCEECGIYLGSKDDEVLDGMTVSHIIPKSTRIDLYYEVENTNLLCRKDHRKWEYGDRKSMRIYEKNKSIIDKLR